MCPSINHAHLTVLFVTSDHIPTLLKLVPKVPNLKMIVCVDIVPLNVATILREWSETQGLLFREFAERLFLLFSSLSYFEILRHSWNLWQSEPNWTYSRLPRSNCVHLLHICTPLRYACLRFTEFYPSFREQLIAPKVFCSCPNSATVINISQVFFWPIKISQHQFKAKCTE